MGALVRRGTAFTQLGVGRSRRVPVELLWSPRDPLAVRLGFPDEHLVWILSRESLFDALAGSGRVGEGDVRFFPDPGTRGLVLELRGVDCTAAFQVERGVLAAFLAVTVAQESLDPCVALDAWLVGGAG